MRFRDDEIRDKAKERKMVIVRTYVSWLKKPWEPVGVPPIPVFYIWKVGRHPPSIANCGNKWPIIGAKK
jgi:hypothetical protein